MLLVNGVQVFSSACEESSHNTTTIETEGIHEIEVIYGDDGFHGHLQLLYQGPDTKDGYSGQPKKTIIGEEAWEKQDCSVMTTRTRTTTQLVFPTRRRASVYTEVRRLC